ncbi:MAG: TonB-dependent receptor plug domain-containing protein, partial [Dehalococcoidales bacterium]|nr:TonB-dependent receptor plug domain-containing protein [Dehalococcoidales bacterium]
MSKVSMLLSMALCAISLVAYAEEPQKQHLDDVVVTGAKPQPRSDEAGVLDAADIVAKRPYVSDTAQLLSDVPGVSLYGAGGVSSLPAIHGLADDRIRTKVNGMDLVPACANHMNPPLSYINPANVESVSVFAGITPVSLGGDSIGGTIIVNSRAPRFAKKGEGLLTSGELG